MPGLATIKKKRAELIERRRLHPYAVLLCSELLLILLYPFVAGATFGDEIFRLLAVFVFLTALYTVKGRGRITTIALILGAPRHLPALGEHRRAPGACAFAGRNLGTRFPDFRYCSAGYLRHLQPQRHRRYSGRCSVWISSDRYHLRFGLLDDRESPAGIIPRHNPTGQTVHPCDFTFFSFVTLTTVGYGDIVPWGSHARSIAIVESMLGIMYPAVLVSRLVGLHGRKHDNSET